MKLSIITAVLIAGATCGVAQETSIIENEEQNRLQMEMEAIAEAEAAEQREVEESLNYPVAEVSESETVKLSSTGEGTVRLEGTEVANKTYYGLYAGYNNVGSALTFVGYATGYYNTGNNNTFVGDFSGFYNTSGGSNTFVGKRSGHENTTAEGNTFVGANSGLNTTVGNINTFIGQNSGIVNTTGSKNVFIGDGSGFNNTVGYNNTYVGYLSGSANASGDYNTFMGDQSGRNNTANGNTFYGSASGFNNTTGSANTFTGSSSGHDNTGGFQNSYYGSSSGYSNTTGYANTYIGQNSGYFNTTGIRNTFMGAGSGYSNTTGDYNVFVGRDTGYDNTTGNSNTYIGRGAGKNNVGSNNVFLGYYAAYNHTTESNKLFIDSSSTSYPLIYGEFDNDVVVINGDLNTTGYITSALDEDNTLKVEFPVALSRTNNASGEHSDVGFSLENKTDGHNGSFKWSFQTSWSNEGFTATKDDTGGYEFVVKNPTDDVNKVELAAAGKTFFKNGALVNPSSRAFKDDIKTLDTKAALEAFAKLEPVTFVYKEHKSEQVVGFIAEDVPELVAINGRDGVNATEIVAVLTKVVQEQDVQMEAMKAEIAELKEMKKKVAQLESILTNLALDTSNTKKEKVSVNLK